MQAGRLPHKHCLFGDHGAVLQTNAVGPLRVVKSLLPMLQHGGSKVSLPVLWPPLATASGGRQLLIASTRALMCCCSCYLPS